MSEAEILALLPALRRYARVLTADAWAADDLVQDTLERACVKWRLWTAGSDLRAWLFTLMHNLHASQYRLTARRSALAPHLPLTDVETELGTAGAADALTLDLQRCLLQLPEDQRTVLLLVSLEGLSYAEAARVTGVAIGTVMSRLARARARLDALLQGDSGGRESPGSARVVPLRRPS